MTTQDITSRVKQCVVKLCRVPDLSDDANIFQLGLLSSLYALKLVEAIEREFAIEVSDDELRVANFCSVQAIAQMVARLEAAAAPTEVAR